MLYYLKEKNKNKFGLYMYSPMKHISDSVKQFEIYERFLVASS